jgi:uncharacterized membrane protein
MFEKITLQSIEHTIVILLILYILNQIRKQGLKKFLISNVVSGLKQIPLTKKIYSNTLNTEVENGIKDLVPKFSKDVKEFSKIPEKAIDQEEILKMMVKIINKTRTS